MKFPLPKRRLFRGILYVISIVLILLAIDLLWIRIDRHITVGPDTTRITSPLKPDGFPDYVRFIEERAGAGVTHDNNAAVLLQQAFGPGILRDFAVQPIYSRLGLEIPPSDDATPYFVSYANYLKEQKATDATGLDPSNAGIRSWTAAQNPLLAGCIERNARALHLMHQAAERRRYFVPMISSPGHEEAIAMLVLQIIPVRELGQIAAARAMLRAGGGDFVAAHADLLDIHKLVRLIAQQPTLVEFASAIELEDVACKADQVIACSEKLTASEARQFLADLQNLPPLPPLEDAIDKGERLFGLDTTIFAARIGLPEANRLIISDFNTANAPLGIMLSLYFVPANFNDAMRLANHFYDRLTEGCKAATFAERIGIARSLESEAQTLHDTAIDPAKTFLSYLMPGLTKILVNYDRARMQLDLTRMVLALAAYHADHHAYPPSLNTLVPNYVAALPSDRFIDAPLHYTSSSNGYLLYSVGQDMHDDDGQTMDRHDQTHSHADDIAVSVQRNP